MKTTKQQRTLIEEGKAMIDISPEGTEFFIKECDSGYGFSEFVVMNDNIYELFETLQDAQEFVKEKDERNG